MSTPPKKRRHKWESDLSPKPDGTFAVGVSNPDYAILLACIVSEFNHLETMLPSILAILLGVKDERAAGYVYRAIRGAKGRYAVMKALLEKAPHNVDKSEEYDALLAEFDGILEGRNDYAHGLWYTHTDSGMVLLAKKDEHGFAFFDAKEEPIENLENLLNRIRKFSLTAALLYKEARKQAPGSKQ